MELIRLLRNVEMFSGLTNVQLEKLAEIFERHEYTRDQVLFSQGEEGDRLFLIQDGYVEVIVESPDKPDGRAIVNLGAGQSVGEMALIDEGPRSATVRAMTDRAAVAFVTREAFENLCETDTAIGYRVMRNIAADLSFRLRRRTRTGT